MRILTKKKQNEILKKVTTCQILCNHHISDIEASTHMTENLADMTIEIGGETGADKVARSVCNHEKGGKEQTAAIKGVVCESEYAYRRFTRIKPAEHHYEEPGEKPYIKYSCPVCEAFGNLHQLTPGEKNCPLCGVNLSWEN